MTLNHSQRRVIRWALCVLAILILFPPWIYVYGTSPTRERGPYRLILLGMPDRKPAEYGVWNPKVDWLRYLAPMAAVSVGAAVLVLKCADRSR